MGQYHFHLFLIDSDAITDTLERRLENFQLFLIDSSLQFLHTLVVYACFQLFLIDSGMHAGSRGEPPVAFQLFLIDSDTVAPIVYRCVCWRCLSTLSHRFRVWHDTTIANLTYLSTLSHRFITCCSPIDTGIPSIFQLFLIDSSI